MLNALRPPSLRVLADTDGIGASKFSRIGRGFFGAGALPDDRERIRRRFIRLATPAGYLAVRLDKSPEIRLRPGARRYQTPLLSGRTRL